MKARWWSIHPRVAGPRTPGWSRNEEQLPMLSRTASDLYWMSRYLDRAENLARMLVCATPPSTKFSMKACMPG
ncbi:hypothetical protein GUY40_02915 [Pseudomonas sp. R5(2019)]|nr:hypothetical protein [Pseudomonas sp. R5(2019)]